MLVLTTVVKGSTTKSAIRELAAGAAVAVSIASGIAFIVVSAIY
jgi:hypothetical protein